MSDTDWSKDEVSRFIAEELNYYGFEVVAADTKQATSPWKRWLWLEKHGFDFHYVSLDGEIAQFRSNRDPAVVTLASERRLLLTLRNAMREILSLPALTADAQAALLAARPLSNRTHWASVRRPYGDEPVRQNPDYPDVTVLAWRFLEADKPDYPRILREILARDDGEPESFDDRRTINGSYVFQGGTPDMPMLATVTRHHFAMAYDAVFPPGNLRMHDAASGAFLKSIATRLA
jgi:hypothetical protein